MGCITAPDLSCHLVEYILKRFSVFLELYEVSSAVGMPWL